MKTKVFHIRGGRIGKEALRVCAEAIRSGGVIAFSTDTVYGLGCNAFHPVGIEKIYALKGRSYSKPLPLLLADVSQLPLVASDIRAEASILMETYWPGPLTLVFKTAPLALHASRGKGTVAVRVPKSPLVIQMLATVGVPFASTSANKSGRPSLTRGEDVIKLFKNKVDVILDGGECPVGQASSVVDVSHHPFTILREEAISKLELTRKLKLG